MYYLYFGGLFAYFRSACAIAIGMCFKAGIAAEIIGIPKGSIGEKLYNAKIYLETPDLFAWTFVIIAVSVLFEKIFQSLRNLYILSFFPSVSTVMAPFFMVYSTWLPAASRRSTVSGDGCP